MVDRIGENLAIRSITKLLLKFAKPIFKSALTLVYCAASSSHVTVPSQIFLGLIATSSEVITHRIVQISCECRVAQPEVKTVEVDRILGAGYWITRTQR